VPDVDVRRATTLAGALVGAALVVTIGAAGTAAAKGPTQVTITDPAGHSTELAGPEDQHGALMQLAEDMGLWEALDPAGEPLPAGPPVHPGREFRVEWTLLGPAEGSGDPGGGTIVQHLYPQARGGPLVHTEPRQDGGPLVPSAGSLVGTPSPSPSSGGWYRASSRLPATLAGLGWETKWSYIEGEPAVDPPGEPAASTLAPDVAEPPEPGRAWHTRAGVRATAAGGAVLAAAAAATVLARRRGRRGAPVAAA
jgi:hypothetical protein